MPQTNISNPEVSVIMPVYNSAQYLRGAIDSVLQQKDVGLELVLIDDGSSDESGTICDEIAKEDDRVAVIHKENGGICSARNAGLKIAKGKYLAFCDNDDEFLPGLLSDNCALAAENDADIVRFCRIREVQRDGKVITKEKHLQVIKEVTVVTNIGQNYNALRNTGNGVWAGIYSRDFLQKAGILFDETIKFGLEDEYFNLQCYLVAKKIVLNPKIYYVWRQRIEHSTSVKYDPNVLETINRCILLEQEVVNKAQVEKYEPGAWQYYLTCGQIAEMYYRMRRCGKQLNIRQKKAELQKFRNNNDIDFTMSKEDEKYLKKRGLSYYIARALFNKKHTWLVYLLFLLVRR